MNDPFLAPASLHPAAVFMVRRACRLGTARRRDMKPYFEASHGSYTRWMLQATQACRGLKRVGLGAGAALSYPGISEDLPRWAGFDALLHEIEQGNKPWITGIEDEELPVFITQWSCNTPENPQVMPALIRAISREAPIVMGYVGLRLGDGARERRIYPIGLEKMGDQWRLVGADLEKSDTPLRVFVLARITEVRIEGHLPKNFVKFGISDGATKIKPQFNPELTEDQRTVMSRELGVENGLITLNNRSIFEFFRRFGRQKISDDAIWPPLENSTEGKRYV